MKLGIALGIAVCFSLAAADANEMVPPAGPGVFTAKQVGPGTFKLVVAGHTFTSRGDIEKYLAYRAARLTIEQEAEWFTLKEDRGKGETVEAVPIWRYKVNESAAWTRWSPFSGAAFISADPKTIIDFEVSAEIVVHKGPMDDADPLAFEAHALSDLLVNQVSPPK
jgi:hypothetical protein